MVEEPEAPSGRGVVRASAAPVSLADVEASDDWRVRTGLSEFDRVLGGGLVPGSLVLLGGEPGIGKSTLLLQATDSLARNGARVVYVCGEESPSQVKLRSQRLGASGEGILLLAEVDMEAIETVARQVRPDVLVVDSIQTAIDSELSGAAGSVGQVRSCTSRLMRLAKGDGITVLLVGHVTKDGSIAGPRVLEHMVDTVLYFEGDTDHLFRVVRAVKNRFGSVSEIGLFEMTGSGLAGVASPSEALLARRERPVAGSVVTAAMEGMRPVLVEIQALVTPSYVETPRRLATGVDRSRLLQVVAVLERHAGVSFGQHDVYVSAVGGVRITEPAADMGLALALASARKDVIPGPGTVAFGEIGLTGEVRKVPHSDQRISEAARMGMSVAVVPPGDTNATSIEVMPVGDVASALRTLASGG